MDITRWVSRYAMVMALTIIFFGASKALAEEPRSFEFTYNFEASEVPADAQSAWAWIPIPPSNERQTMHGFTVHGDIAYDIVSENEYGNAFLRFNLLEIPANNNGGRSVSVTFKVTRIGYQRGAYERDGGDNPRWLAPDSLIPLDGVVAEEANSVAGGQSDPFSIGRTLYDHVVDTVVYSKEGEGWGRGDAIFAHDVRQGNCTDFHSLFIGQARALGVPARFFMGFNVPPARGEGEVPGYHCWGEFYAEGQGWVPIDASEAAKKPERREELFGGMDNDRLEFVMGRDIQLEGSSAGRVNFIIYPYIEVNGSKHDKLTKSFSYKDF